MHAKRKGFALLLVLFIMALMVIIAVRINEHWQQLLLSSQYQQSQIVTRWALLGAEALARYRLAQALSGQRQVKLQQPWHNVTRNLQLEGIDAQGLIRDRDGCFNLNALSSMQWPDRGNISSRLAQDSADRGTEDRGLSDNSTSGNSPGQPSPGSDKGQLINTILVFYHMLINSGLDSEQAKTLTITVLNWFGTPLPPGLQQPEQNSTSTTETSAGSNRTDSENTSGVRRIGAKGQTTATKRLMVDISQLREIRGIDQNLYLSLARQVCVHRDNQLAVNINTLTVQQAPLLAALLSYQLSPKQATTILQQRPSQGWASVDDFMKQNNLPFFQGRGVQGLTTESHYFELLIWLQAAGQVYPLRTLLQSKRGRLYVLQRRYGWGE